MEAENKDSINGHEPADEDFRNGNGNSKLDWEKQDDEPVYDAETERRTNEFDKGDPFGDETNAEVRYRTMSWW